MNVGDYVRALTFGKQVKIARIEEIEDGFIYLDNKFVVHDIIKSSPNILELLEPMDLLYIDISPDNCGGIVVPRIPETQNELYKIMCGIGRKAIVLKGVVTHEQLEKCMYKVGE